MVPVDQTEFSDGKGKHGNCLSACIASILEIDLAIVPNFANSEDNWFRVWWNWCKENHIFLDVSSPEVMTEEDGYWIGSGLGPRGFHHGVVMLGNKIVHDPHPSRGGVARIEYAYVIKHA